MNTTPGKSTNAILWRTTLPFVADPLAASYLVGGTLEEYVQLLSLFTLVLMSCKRNPHISFNHQHIISRLAHSFNDADVMSLTSSSTPLTISQHTSHFLSPISNHGPHAPDYKRTHVHWSKICKLDMPNSIVPENEWTVAEYVEGKTVEKEFITSIYFPMLVQWKRRILTIWQLPIQLYQNECRLISYALPAHTK